jgi:hypothetical protein
LKTSVVQHLPEENIKWRLTNPSDGGDELEEVVLRIQGILCEKDLPPIRIGNKSVKIPKKKKKDNANLPTSDL